MIGQREIWVFRAKLVRVVDGDTLDLQVDLGFHQYGIERFRLEGVDTPERGEGMYSVASQFVARRLDGQQLRIETTKTDSFGRWLARVFVGDVCLNDELLEKGFAVPYRRGT